MGRAYRSLAGLMIVGKKEGFSPPFISARGGLVPPVWPRKGSGSAPPSLTMLLPLPLLLTEGDGAFNQAPVHQQGLASPLPYSFLCFSPPSIVRRRFSSLFAIDRCHQTPETHPSCPLFSVLSSSFCYRILVVAGSLLSFSCRTSPSISATPPSSPAKFATHGFSTSPTKRVHCLCHLPCCCFPSSSSPWFLLLSTAVTSFVVVTGVIFPVADHLFISVSNSRPTTAASLLCYPRRAPASPSDLTSTVPPFSPPPTSCDFRRLASSLSISPISIPCLISFLCLSSSFFTPPPSSLLPYLLQSPPDHRHGRCDAGDGVGWEEEDGS